MFCRVGASGKESDGVALELCAKPYTAVVRFNSSNKQRLDGYLPAARCISNKSKQQIANTNLKEATTATAVNTMRNLPCQPFDSSHEIKMPVAAKKRERMLAAERCYP